AWTYWLGRAELVQGKRDEAVARFTRLSGQPNFYGNLADDELGRPILPPSRAEQPSADEIASAAADASIRRALMLFRLGPDLRMEAIREWNWALRGRDDRFLLAAAEVAQRNEIWDRAINTADRTSGEHNYDLRYLAPFKDLVAPRASELGLDPAWVYGLMRQESRFVMNVRSSAGAQGLMQLMPATARWVAKRIGLKDFSPSRISDMDTNVTLGTNYLSIVYSDLGNDPVLASAAYNAGPGRARRWRDARPLEGAIYAETIPFNETRDYVKKVMSNAIYYAAQFEGKPQSLKLRLGTVRPPGVEPASDTP
ncbi:MAG: lytic transglycosylase domain-containing protein, partial [Candidatus Methylophosphatis roskildensis]